MSVINNVLKNLESRESKFTPIEIDTIASSSSAPARDLKPLLLIAVLLTALAAVAWYYLQDQIFQPVSTSVPAEASIAPELPSPVVQHAVEAEPESATGVVADTMIGNQIIGLQIRESEQDMSMEFALRDRVVAYLKERGENSFGYHLRDVESQIVAPLISDNRWILELEIVSSATGVDINFLTAADILVETRQELRDGEPIWSINLRKSAAPADSDTEADAGVAVARSEEPAVSLAQPAPAPVEVQSPAVAAQTAVAEASVGPVEIDIKSTNPNAASINQLEYAVQLINSGRTAKAEALLQGLLGGEQDYTAREHLLALYGRQRQIGRKQRLLRGSMVRYPDAALFKTEYARSLFQGAGYRAVIEFFAKEATIDVTQQALVAASYQRLDEHQDAIKHYQMALAQDANNARNWIGLAISQENTAALEEALNSYRRAARLGGLNSRLRAFVASRSSALEQVLN